MTTSISATLTEERPAADTCTSIPWCIEPNENHPDDHRGAVLEVPGTDWRARVVQEVSMLPMPCETELLFEASGRPAHRLIVHDVAAILEATKTVRGRKQAEALILHGQEDRPIDQTPCEVPWCWGDPGHTDGHNGIECDLDDDGIWRARLSQPRYPRAPVYVYLDVTEPEPLGFCIPVKEAAALLDLIGTPQGRSVVVGLIGALTRCEVFDWCTEQPFDESHKAGHHSSAIIELAGSDGTGSAGSWGWLSSADGTALDLVIETAGIRGDQRYEAGSALALLEATQDPAIRRKLIEVLTAAVGES